MREQKEGCLAIGPKSTVTSLALPSMVGDSALALHYINIVIIIIEKLLQYPHMVGLVAHDDNNMMQWQAVRRGASSSSSLCLPAKG